MIQSVRLQGLRRARPLPFRDHRRAVSSAGPRVCRLSRAPARYAVTRDMRVSSPSLTKAFIDGAVLQGGTISTTA